MTTLLKTVINSDQLLEVFDSLSNCELIKLYDRKFTILVVLIDQEWIKKGIYTTFRCCKTLSDLKNITEWSYESILKREYLIDAIAYCEDHEVLIEELAYSCY
jgi:hypothetical protein